MKAFTSSLLLVALLGSETAQAIGHKKHHTHSHKHEISKIRNEFVALNLDENQSLFSKVNQKIDDIKNLVQVKKMQPECDSVCQQGCDKEADTMIRELKNPLRDITWNCKNNYDVYTSDYDLEHSHFDRISMDVMETQRTLNQIKALEKNEKDHPWDWQTDEAFTEHAVLRQLKKELGLPED